MPPTHQQTHNAGRHLAVAQALVAQVQVAAKGSWQIQDIDRYLSGTVERVVLVDIRGTTPEFYVVEGDRLREIVKRRYEAFLSRVGGTRPRNPESKHSRIDPSDVRRWRNRWSLFG